VIAEPRSASAVIITTAIDAQRRRAAAGAILP
jgi:hypothetical protein